MTDVVLVDEDDRQVGVREKQRAHLDGALHRAVSVFVFDSTGRKMLLQQRALGKYHSGGLWSNACCSHPAPREAALDAAHRRLVEELGFDCPLEFAFSFIYRADVGESLVEHEFDHVFIGRCDATTVPHPDEIAAVEWVDVRDMLDNLKTRPERYSPWFGIAIDEMRKRSLI